MTRYAPLWQQANSYAAALDRQLISTLWAAGGAVGGICSASATTMQVTAAPGTAAVPLQSGQGCALCRWDANEVVTLAGAPPSGQSRIDLVIVQVRDNALDAGANNDFIVTNVTGVPAASAPATPATPTNALVLAQVLVPGAVANLSTATVTDQRGPLGPALGHVADARGPVANTPIQANYITATATFRAIAGRRYRINANAAGYNNGSAAALMTWSFYDETGTNWVMSQAAPAVGSWFGASYVWQLVCATTRVVTYQIQGAAAAPAVLQTPANNTLLLAEDIGPV